MSFFKNYNYDLWVGAYGILLTASILTVFEVYFFFNIVVPGIKSSITTGLNTMGYGICNYINNKINKKENVIYASDYLFAHILKEIDIIKEKKYIFELLKHNNYSLKINDSLLEINTENIENIKEYNNFITKLNNYILQKDNFKEEIKLIIINELTILFVEYLNNYDINDEIKKIILNDFKNIINDVISEKINDIDNEIEMNIPSKINNQKLILKIEKHHLEKINNSMVNIVKNVYNGFKEYYLENSDNYENLTKKYIQSLLINFSESDNSPLKTFAKREKFYIDRNNKTVLFIGFFILIVLFLLLTIINIKIKTHSRNNATERFLKFISMSKDKKQATIVALFTVGILIIFQIFFYFFGLEYLYIGTGGIEELYKFTLDNLEDKENKNMRT